MTTRESSGLSLEDGRSYLPWIIAAVVVIVGGSKIDALRPYLARGVALVGPVVAVTCGAYRFRGLEPGVEKAALVIGGVTVVAAEVCIGGGFFEMQRLSSLLTPARAALLIAVAAALALHTFVARRGHNPRYGAWIGIAAAFAWYLSSYTGPDLFSGVFTGFFYALGLGGGVGLLAGEALRRFFRYA